MPSTKKILAFVGLVLLPSNTLGCLPGMSHSHANDNEAPALQIREQPPVATGITALKNVRVFDGHEIHRPGAVVFNGSTLIDNEFESQADRVIDGKGGVLLPGLIESHAHPGSIDDLKKLISWGVTTVMSMACHNYALCDSLRNQVGLTDYRTAGQPAQGTSMSQQKSDFISYSTDRVFRSTFAACNHAEHAPEQAHLEA